MRSSAQYCGTFGAGCGHGVEQYKGVVMFVACLAD
jgi:hypothetical protein